MKIISALAIIVSAGSALAAESSNLREREQGDRKLFGGCYWPWNDCSDRTTIKAVFDSNNNIYGVKGTIKFIQSSDELTSGKWVVKLNEFDLDKAESQDGASCANNLNFHIHENKVDDSGECGFAVTGNHWDPTFGCGKASEWQRKECNGDATDGTTCCCKTVFGGDGQKTCDSQNPHTTCEIGDLSNRLGKIKVDTHLIGKSQVFKDDFIADVNEFKDFSIVIHCGSPRVACGNFAVV